MLPKAYKISSGDFKYIYDKGYKVRGEFGMAIALLSREGNNPRFGFVVNSKVGNAVQRHSLTRKLRAIVMEYVKETNLTSPLLVEYVSYKYTDNYPLLKNELYGQLDKIVKKLVK